MNNSFNWQARLNEVYARFPEANYKPIIGITGNYDSPDCKLGEGYYKSVLKAGGIPVIIPPVADTDAVITSEKGLCIAVKTADCIPVLLYDAKHHAAAAIHAGWRGTVAGIVRKCVVEMHQCFDTDPADLKAVIGPGISLERFEVGQEVYDQFAQAGFDMDRIARMYAKWHIDLPLCNQLQLQQTGIKYENIEMSGICTHTQSDEYFSARKLGINSGRIYTGIILK